MNGQIDEAAVWRRVNAAAEEKKAEGEAPIGPKLMELLERGLVLAEAHSALNRGGRRRHGAFAQGQRSENRLLKGLYFMHTGLRPRPQAAGARRSRTEAYTDRLRWMLEVQGSQQDSLETLAHQIGGKTGHLLMQLAQKAAERWDALMEELAEQLEKT